MNTWTTELQKCIIYSTTKTQKEKVNIFFFKIELAAVVKEEQTSRLNYKIYFSDENIEGDKIILLISDT